MDAEARQWEYVKKTKSKVQQSRGKSSVQMLADENMICEVDAGAARSANQRRVMEAFTTPVRPNARLYKAFLGVCVRGWFLHG